ncbi:formate/nitrite transporter family protein [Mesobacillus foraminis]|uniref:formate/nitrite transporter family protein n=1 Tax=Mesobacillus foraminis TaxID=279826 RepID=UPI0039A01BF3
MSSEPYQLAIDSAMKKRSVLQSSFTRYILKAGLAGVYIGFGIMVSYRLGEAFYDVHSPATYLISSIFFGLALILIVFGGAELFTGNTMIFVMSTLGKKTTIKDTLSNWAACYSGNLLGALFFAVFISFTGLLGSPEKSQFIMEAASIKMTTSSFQLFFRAILCNWLVCLAAYWIPFHVKGDGAKIGVMMLLVFAFVASGFEHSIANMALFLMAILVPHPETVNLIGMVHNLIPVTIGNIIGGGFFVGCLYFYLASRPLKDPAAIANVSSAKKYKQRATTRI